MIVYQDLNEDKMKCMGGRIEGNGKREAKEGIGSGGGGRWI